MLRAGLFTLLFALPAGADEIAGPAGQRLMGTLVLSGGRLAFQGADGRTLAKEADLGPIKLARSRQTFRAAPAHVLMLSDHERLTGVFLGMDKETLSLRTAWAKQLRVPKAATNALTHLPGWRTVLHESFAGKPTLLMRGGLVVAIPVAPPLAAARVSVLFREVDRPAGGRWAVLADYNDKDRTRTVRIILAGEGETLSVDAGGLPGTARVVRRSSEPRCLTVEHSAGSLRIVCDDEPLCYTLDAGPGLLRRVRLVCLAGEAKVVGGVSVSGVTVEAAEPVRRRSPGDPTRDELWLASGDQLFGLVRSADARGIEIAGKFAPRFYAWKELRGWYPRRSVVQPAPAVKGVKVRLEIDSGMRTVPDVLEGVLTALDGKQATLQHATLGELTIPRSRIMVVTGRAG